MAKNRVCKVARLNKSIIFQEGIWDWRLRPPTRVKNWSTSWSPFWRKLYIWRVRHFRTPVFSGYIRCRSWGRKAGLFEIPPWKKSVDSFRIPFEEQISRNKCLFDLEGLLASSTCPQHWCVLGRYARKLHPENKSSLYGVRMVLF